MPSDATKITPTHYHFAAFDLLDVSRPAKASASEEDAVSGYEAGFAFGIRCS